ncbi:hypothetical protein GCM10023208_06920 [Erythrobacter westpacificensis]|uniref:FCD domain-containing protein n=1 Tax=Erythrobacter westpacificensis TaxID=1055231 RepID=A0ABP9K121_9SPHN
MAREPHHWSSCIEADPVFHQALYRNIGIKPPKESLSQSYASQNDGFARVNFRCKARIIANGDSARDVPALAEILSKGC